MSRAESKKQISISNQSVMNPPAAKIEMPCCPVCGSRKSQKLDEYPVTDLCAAYRRQLSVDVSKEFPDGLAALMLRQCEICGLQFSDPMVSGSADFYSQLAAQETYYSETRWEFEIARHWLESSNSVLDVGCGDGFFLSLLPHQNKFGLEFNPRAVAAAQQRGINVKCGDLAGLDSASFDAITIFHVLEHLSEPISLLNQALRVLKPNGLLIISVPNNDAFIGEDIQHPANAPPHHTLRWRASSLGYLPKILPLKLEALQREPLTQPYLFLHRRTRITGFIGRIFRRRLPLMKRNLLTISASKIANVLALLSLKIRPRMAAGSADGFSLLAVYRKT